MTEHTKDPGKTHFADDDDTIAYIAQLEQQLADKHQLFMCASSNYDRLAEQLAECERERDELLAAVLSVCCDPEGNVVIRGSDGDRAVLQAALAKLGADKTGGSNAT